MQPEYINFGKEKLIESIKFLLYKKDSQIFERLDFDNDAIYQEPLLFTFFNNEKNERMSLDAILFGYTKPELKPMRIDVKSDSYGRIYLPNFGWIHTNRNNENYILVCDNEDIYLVKDNEKIDFRLESLCYVENNKLELIKYPIPLVNELFIDVNQKIIPVEVENITTKCFEHFKKAWNLIREYAPEHHKLICSVTKKALIFREQNGLRNSFATMNGQGMIFLNAYQDDYNEVFFIDDIAHQSGHVIFNALIYNTSDFINIDPSTIVIPNNKINKTSNQRSIYILFHALYTYYATFVCLDACLEAQVLSREKEHEALGRIRFYINKCQTDLALLNEFESSLNMNNNLFTSKGTAILNEIKSNFGFFVRKWLPMVQHFNISGQPYNFTYSIFSELNPINEVYS